MTRWQEFLKGMMRGLFSGISVFIAVGIYGGVWLGYYNRVIREPFLYRGRWLLIAMYTALYLLFMRLYGGFRAGHFKTGNLIYSQILSAVLTDAFTYVQLSAIDKKLLNPFLLAGAAVAQAITAALWIFLFQKLYGQIFPPKKLLFIMGSDQEKKLMEKIDSREDKYVIGKVLSCCMPVPVLQAEMGRWDAVLLGDLPSHERNLLLKFCFISKIRSYSIPKISDILIRTSQELDVFDTPLYLSRNLELTLGQMIGKRMMDVIGAAALGVLTLPLFLLIGLGVKAMDGGPVFYTQERLTRDGEIFRIYKFRTMVLEAERDGKARMAEKDDARILPVGRFLRRTRMDELPQLFNILKGEMSLVGPRPERPELAEKISRKLPEFSFRLKVKAGLTGYAQVYGKYNTTAYDKLKMDLTYIRSYSFLNDLKLICMTPKILLMKESTQEAGEEENT